MSDQIVLCQGCLRISPYSDEKHSSEELCVCGSDFCGCDGCIDTAQKLLAGERSAAQLGTINDIGQWTAEEGTSASEPASGAPAT